MVTDYDKAALAAKVAFQKRLKAATGRLGMSQKELSGLVGMTSSMVSTALKDPSQISEGFIRAVAVSVSGMEASYKAFRDAVDGPYLPGRKTKNMSLQAKEAALDETIDQISQLLEALRKLV